MLIITKINPISSNNIVKISTPIVSDSEVFLSKIATGINNTAATIKISPIFSRFSMKQIDFKTTKIHSKTLALHPLIFEDT
ncbi:hypothetical protein [Pedobacter frigiditerrae]|uniref:hypothetical protein n=1 Tax=Pedobacter frigiditerrae TaxID=2530452 RepID=UPI00292F6B16|nr:hypothetical protein [Pedobacter frigiditerrae]